MIKKTLNKSQRNSSTTTGSNNTVSKPTKTGSRIQKTLNKSERKASKAASKGNLTKARKINTRGKIKAEKIATKANTRKKLKAATKAGASRAQVRTIKKDGRQAVRRLKKARKTLTGSRRKVKK